MEVNGSELRCSHHLLVVAANAFLTSPGFRHIYSPKSMLLKKLRCEHCGSADCPQCIPSWLMVRWFVSTIVCGSLCSRGVKTVCTLIYLETHFPPPAPFPTCSCL